MHSNKWLGIAALLLFWSAMAFGQEVITWQQAAEHIGENVTVEGKVLNTYNSGKVIFINFDADYVNNLSAVIFKQNVANFPEAPEKYYDKKTVRVSGKIIEYKGKPEIIVSSPSQIEIVADKKAVLEPKQPAQTIPPPPVAQMENVPVKETKEPLLMAIGLGIVLVLVVVLIYFIRNKKKNVFLDNFVSSLKTMSTAGTETVVLNRYKILKEIGRGGMGTVFEVTDTKLNRIVALKKVKEELSIKSQYKEQFIKEARIAANLKHKNIVTIYDIQEDDKGMVYLVFEYIEGNNLSDVIAKQKKIPWQKTVSLSAQICDALDYAHKQGIVPRDIKPANIMVDSNNTVKVLDFGIARLAQDAIYTMTGSVTGTPAYMAPEQHLNQECDLRVDIFGLGATMYEMVSGTPPFVGGDVYTQKEHGVIPSLAELVPELPKTLEDIIRKCLMPKKEDRYSSATEAAQDLIKLTI
ncbi:MAG: protein kinase [Candidatus Margulisiibacteriota bacterium]